MAANSSSKSPIPSATTVLSQIQVPGKSNETVTTFSHKHRICLFVIRWLGCPLCKQWIQQLADYYTHFLEANTLPIVVHQESYQEAQPYFDKYKASLLVHTTLSSMDKTMLAALGYPSWSYYKQIHTTITSVVPYLLTRGMELPSKSVKHSLLPFAVLVVEQGQITHKEFGKNKPIKVEDVLLHVEKQQKVLPSISQQQRDSLYALFPSSYVFVTSNQQPQQQTTTASLAAVLQHKSLRNSFKTFAKSEYSLENLLFIEQLEAYKQATNVEKRHSLAQGMIDNFLRHQSDLEINISNQLQTSVIATFEAHGALPTLFDSVADELKLTVISDCFNRFKKSSEFRRASLK